AEIDQFVMVGHDTFFTGNGVGYQTASDATDGQAVGADVFIGVVGGLDSPSARHVFGYNGWLSGNMFFEIGQHGSRHHVRASARFSALNNRDRLSLIERSLRKSGGGKK